MLDDFSNREVTSRKMLPKANCYLKGRCACYRYLGEFDSHFAKASGPKTRSFMVNGKPSGRFLAKPQDRYAKAKMRGRILDEFVETIEFPPEALLALANEFETSICFDTGHVLAGFPGNVDFWEALEKCLPRLSRVHLHDCRAYANTQQLGYGKDQQPLGKGDLSRALSQSIEADKLCGDDRV